MTRPTTTAPEPITAVNQIGFKLHLLTIIFLRKSIVMNRKINYMISLARTNVGARDNTHTSILYNIKKIKSREKFTSLKRVYTDGGADVDPFLVNCGEK